MVYWLQGARLKNQTGFLMFFKALKLMTNSRLLIDYKKDTNNIQIFY